MYYNLVVTGLSITAAFLVGTVEILGVLTDELHLHGHSGTIMSNFDINKAGFTIAGAFPRGLDCLPSPYGASAESRPAGT